MNKKQNQPRKRVSNEKIEDKPGTHHTGITKKMRLADVERHAMEEDEEEEDEEEDEFNPDGARFTRQTNSVFDQISEKLNKAEAVSRLKPLKIKFPC